jgi:uncharacterized protein (TIGR01627 family)
MIKIRLLEHEIHRNETTFRPFIFAQNTLREVGIEFTTSDDYDYAWVGQASIIDKKKSLQESIDKGLEFLSKLGGDYMIVDGQDATSLVGTIDVFRESEALLFLKNSYLKDFDLYKQGWINGRMYWGKGEYSVSDIDDLKPRMKLTGCNWLGTIQPQWMNYNSDKQYDISCMFSWGDIENFEHDIQTNIPYDDHRRILLEKLEKTNYNVVRRERGIRIPQEQFYQNMYNSKIVMAPIGYGEMAVRDIEAASFGSVLIKPDMDYIYSKPFVYEDGETYISCKYDWSDVEEKIDYVLSNYKELQPHLVENMRKRFSEEYSHEHLAVHLYDIFRNLPSMSVENVEQSTTDLSLNEVDKIQTVVNICDGMCFDQYKSIYNCIKSKKGSNVLVFGVGSDSDLWYETNEGGKTIFLENNDEWFANVTEKSPHLDVRFIKYTGDGHQSDELLQEYDSGNHDCLLIDLPEDIRKIKWDVIIVDGPAAWDNKYPCRMKSIYEAYNLSKNTDEIDIFVHDTHRKIEIQYCDYFLRPNFEFVEEITDPVGTRWEGRKLFYFRKKNV